MEYFSVIVGIAVVIFLIAFIIRCFRIVPQAHVFVIERLGSFHAEWQTGMHVLVPFIDRIAGKVSLKEKVVDFKPQPVITKDNVTMQIDTVVFYQVTDAKQYIYGVERPLAAIENLSATTLRNIIGEMELDSTLTSRDIINTKITSILDQATDRWGIKVNRVELKNILPPREIQDAMEKQMKAERERRLTRNIYLYRDSTAYIKPALVHSTEVHMIGFRDKLDCRIFAEFSQFNCFGETLPLGDTLKRRAVFTAVNYSYIAAQLIGKPFSAEGISAYNGNNLAADESENIRIIIREDIIKLYGLLLNAVIYTVGSRYGLSVNF